MNKTAITIYTKNGFYNSHFFSLLKQANTLQEAIKNEKKPNDNMNPMTPSTKGIVYEIVEQAIFALPQPEEGKKPYFYESYLTRRILGASKELLDECNKSTTPESLKTQINEWIKASDPGEEERLCNENRALSCKVSGIKFRFIDEHKEEEERTTPTEEEAAIKAEIETALKGKCPFSLLVAPGILKGLADIDEKHNLQSRPVCLEIEITEKQTRKTEKLPESIRVGTNTLKQITHTLKAQAAAAFIGVLAYADKSIFEKKEIQPTTKFGGFWIEINGAQLNGIAAAVLGEDSRHRERIFALLQSLSKTVSGQVSYDAMGDDGRVKVVTRPFAVISTVADKKTGQFEKLFLNLSPSWANGMRGGYGRIAEGAFELRRKPGGNEAFLLYLAVLSHADQIAAAKRSGQNFVFSVSFSDIFGAGVDPTHLNRPIERARKHLDAVADLVGAKVVVTQKGKRTTGVKFVFINEQEAPTNAQISG